MTTRIALHGAGRMAGAVAQAAQRNTEVEISSVVALEPPGWEIEVPFHSRLDELQEQVDVMIDFSLPDGTAAAAAWCEKRSVPLLSGVTGLHPQALDGLKSASQSVAVMWAPNLSVGVNLLAQLCTQAAAILPRETSVVIEDLHHQWKKDAPSGTALMLGEAIKRARGEQSGSLEYVSLREGDAIGRHRVTFRSPGEEMVLVHEAQDRSIFATGALGAAQWLVHQEPGQYTVADWLMRR